MVENAPWGNSETPETRKYLLSWDESLNYYTDWCPSAKTLLAYSETLQQNVVIQIKCKRWGCPHCGARKVRSLGFRVEDACPNRLITLTVWSELFETPREAYDRTRRLISVFVRKVRKKYGEFEYLKILEITKKGWPHYHLVVRSKYIPQTFLSETWAEISGSRIVDVRQIKKTQNVFWYIVKYLSKQKYIHWTNRRVSWSRHFFDPEKKLNGEPLKLHDKELIDKHPYWWIFSNVRKKFLAKFSKDILVYSDEKETIMSDERFEGVSVAHIDRPGETIYTPPNYYT